MFGLFWFWYFLPTVSFIYKVNCVFIMSFTRDQVVALIDLYRSHEILYVVKNPLYHNKNARQQILEKITQKMCTLRPNTTVNEIKAKLNSLRTQFNKELARLRNAPSGSGAEAVRISLWCFENLLFLQDQTVATPSVFNLKLDKECTGNEVIEINNYQESMSVLDEESDPENFNSNIKTSTSSKKSTNEHNIAASASSIYDSCRKRKKADGASNSALKEIGNALTNLSNKTDTQDDHLDIFGKYIASELRAISSKTVQKRCKNAIVKVLLQFIDEDEDN